jgi:uncharacterized protein involved in response to NO
LKHALSNWNLRSNPALLSCGFRPFFLFGSVHAGAIVFVSFLVFTGSFELSSAFTPRDWHAHEMLYGFLPAIITGFLLTAIPNWTGRLPIRGLPLAVLVSAWAAGRIAVVFSAQIGWLATAVIDVSFLAIFAAAALREIIAGRNWRNLKIIGIVAVFASGNFVFHLETYFRGTADYGLRVGIAAVILLLTVVGGRIVPSFTRNWLAKRGTGRLPSPFGYVDVAVLATSFGALILWLGWPHSSTAAGALGLAGLLHLVRLARWAGERTLQNRLVLVLHVAYVFIPLGFLLAAAAALGWIAATAGIHAWMTGAVGTMTLAVMTRASLGHTGHALVASTRTQIIYAAVVVSAIARICASLFPVYFEAFVIASAVAWIAAFAGFAVVYGPMLCQAQNS